MVIPSAKVVYYKNKRSYKGMNTLMKNKQQLTVNNGLRDRGMMKWQGMMLTEHVNLLKAWYEEEEHIPEPNLNEFDLQLLQGDLEVAMKRKSMVKLKTWRDKKVYEHVGMFETVDSHSRYAVYSDSSGMKRVPINEIFSVELLD